MLLELLLHPLSLTEVGFQLSYLATFGILVFYRLFNQLFQSFLPKRTFYEAKKLSLIDKHGYLLSNAIRAGLALNFSVHIITLPVVLYTFHLFPLLSLPYNLIFPPLLGLSLLLIPLGILCPPLAYLNAKYTGFLLKLIANPPEILNFKIHAPSFSMMIPILIVTALGIFGLTTCQKLDKIEGLFHRWRS